VQHWSIYSRWDKQFSDNVMRSVRRIYTIVLTTDTVREELLE